MELREAYERYKNNFLSLSTGQKKAIKCAIGIFTAIFLLFIFIYIIQEVPRREVAEFGMTNPKDLAEIENSYRATLAQILGGIAIGIGLYYTWRRVAIAEKDLKVSQEGQITERFTRAVDQLGAIDQFGKPAIEIRLGGIYSLERISNESEKDYWPIMEILTAYVRKNSSVEITRNKKVTSQVTDVQANESVKGEFIKFEDYCPEDPWSGKPSLDIQAILTVIGRRKKFFSNGESIRLNLRGTCLKKADLEGAYLTKTDFDFIHLERVILEGADLTEAKLDFVNLEKANLRRACFSHAFLKEASLEGAFLEFAHLKGVDLKGANLRGSICYRTCFEEAILEGADLEKAWFGKSNLKGAILEGANFEGADLKEAYLEGANFEGARNLTIDQLSKVNTLYNAKFDEEFLPLKEKYPALFEKTDYYEFLLKDFVNLDESADNMVN